MSLRCECLVTCIQDALSVSVDQFHVIFASFRLGGRLDKKKVRLKPESCFHERQKSRSSDSAHGGFAKAKQKFLRRDRK